MIIFRQMSSFIKMWFIIIKNIFHYQFPAFRCVARPEGVQPSPFATCGVPRDIIDLATGQDPYKLMDLLKLVSQNFCDHIFLYLVLRYFKA